MSSITQLPNIQLPQQVTFTDPVSGADVPFFVKNNPSKVIKTVNETLAQMNVSAGFDRDMTVRRFCIVCGKSRFPDDIWTRDWTTDNVEELVGPELFHRAVCCEALCQTLLGHAVTVAYDPTGNEGLLKAESLFSHVEQYLKEHN